INTMIYIGNIEILTAKSAIYLGNVGLDEESSLRPARVLHVVAWMMIGWLGGVMWREAIELIFRLI
ncbi:hypothetical protein, partial [Sphingomonas ginsenosidimutans]|uniref:hypothetical protein n=1 Tax=Sphingomonas ginsenosidimutans TaxID=862134 RepID=UPI001D76B692